MQTVRNYISPMNRTFFRLIAVLLSFSSFAQSQDLSKFKQLEEELPSPNTYRDASGAPGPDYWQQKVDYQIDVELDAFEQRLYGEETIVYHNNSPQTLRYLWVQLDQNVRAQHSMSSQISKYKVGEEISLWAYRRVFSDFDGGYKIDWVKDEQGNHLKTAINETMMRVDLPIELGSGESFKFSIKWWYNINDCRKIGGRSGYEYLEQDDEYLFEIAQWFPRLAVYNDARGWQNKQFLGRGEFALEFGDYEVNITVPADHVVASTGSLLNPKEVLSEEQSSRLDEAAEKKEPVYIVSPEEAAQNIEKEKSKEKKTWRFRAENVRDFAFASSRAFMWDAMGQDINGRNVMCMSYFPRQGNPLWHEYSTKAVANAIEVYSKHTIDYPYPVSISVNGPVGGMEYPMITFNGARPNSDGTYTDRRKRGLISVITHEVGHNFFPMIINSDERQWTWMDEGINTFVQYLAEQNWDPAYPSRSGPPGNIVYYMRSDKEDIVPIMTNSESILNFGANAYHKPATAMNILRSSVLGPELFDHAFREYAKRWAFKHPEPADLFRTLEDASATDLDWFWRGWFYTTDNVDQSLENVVWHQLDYKNTSINTSKNDQSLELSRDARSLLKEWDKLKKKSTLKEGDIEGFEKHFAGLSEESQKRIKSATNLYTLHVENKGGLIMPVIVELTYLDGEKETLKFPAEVWLKSEDSLKKQIITEKPVLKFTLDPNAEIADVDLSNNTFPKEDVLSRFDEFKLKGSRERP